MYLSPWRPLLSVPCLLFHPTVNFHPPKRWPLLPLSNTRFANIQSPNWTRLNLARTAKSFDRRERKLKFNVTRSWYTRFQLDSRNCKGPTVAPISKVAPGSKVNALPTQTIGTRTIYLRFTPRFSHNRRSKSDDFSPVSRHTTNRASKNRDRSLES